MIYRRPLNTDTLGIQEFLALSVLVRILQRKRTCVSVLKEIYYEKLVHVIVEAEKSHHLLSPSWRPRKAGAVIQSKSFVLRTWGPNSVGGVNPSPRIKDEMRSRSSINEV